MAKSKKNKIKIIEPKINTDTLDIGNVYMFYNTLFNINIFINANGFDQAMEKFDLCNFKHRDQWKVFLQCGKQPVGSKK